MLRKTSKCIFKAQQRIKMLIDDLLFFFTRAHGIKNVGLYKK